MAVPSVITQHGAVSENSVVALSALAESSTPFLCSLTARSKSMPFLVASERTILPVSSGKAMGERDHRGELVRVRLSEQDLARISAIQDYYEREGSPSSLQRVIADAIDTHYSVLVSQGSVEPNL